MNYLCRKRNALKIGTLFMVSILSSIASDACGQSLFDRRDSRMLDPCTNYVAKDVGDLLVVMINESTDVENSDTRSMGKSGNSNVVGSLNYSVGGDLGSGAGVGDLGSTTNSTRNFTGDSEVRSEHAFSDRFTVTVIDVLRNGNLVVAGKRKVSIRGDTRTLILSGVIRQRDVLPNNIVSSQLVGNLEIGLESKGQSQSFSGQGWLGRKLNNIWPF